MPRLVFLHIKRANPYSASTPPDQRRKFSPRPQARFFLGGRSFKLPHNPVARSAFAVRSDPENESSKREQARRGFMPAQISRPESDMRYVDSIWLEFGSSHRGSILVNAGSQKTSSFWGGTAACAGSRSLLATGRTHLIDSMPYNFCVPTVNPAALSWYWSCRLSGRTPPGSTKNSGANSS
jgi:hypothetical protein